VVLLVSGFELLENLKHMDYLYGCQRSTQQLVSDSFVHAIYAYI
jgi:hypothetical protein